MCQYICIRDRGGDVYSVAFYVKQISQDVLLKKADLPPRRVTNTMKHQETFLIAYSLVSTQFLEIVSRNDHQAKHLLPDEQCL